MGRELSQIRRRTLDPHQFLVLGHIQPRYGPNQSLCVGVAGPLKDILRSSTLHQTARIDHLYFLRVSGYHAQVVGDDDQSCAILAAQAVEHFQQLCLDGDIQGCSRFVCNEYIRAAAHGHGDHDALLHTTGKLIRVVFDALLWVWDSD